MIAQPAPSNHPVFLLAEHLDSVLAAIEDLEATRPGEQPADPLTPLSRPRLSVRRFVTELAHHEGSAIVRLGRARRLTRELVRRDRRFAMLGGLFVSGTAALEDAVPKMLDTTGVAFATGGDPIAFLSSRGVIAPDQGTVALSRHLAIGDDFRIAGEIEVGPLKELISTFLNTIELHF